MSQIKAIYFPDPPSFPASTQHPDAVRYQVGNLYIDAVGGQPSQGEIDAVMGTDAAGQAAAARAATDEAERAADKLDAQVMSFLDMTPAQRANWITNNVSGPGVTTLAQVKAGLDTALNVLAAMAAHGARGQRLRD